MAFMPITKGAAKTHRSSNKKRVFNVRRNSAMKEVVKDIKKAVLAGEKKKAEEMMPTAYKAIDKAEKRGIIKKNTASRKKSRLVTMIKRGS
jgi:small subunit ribosomal protein S20